MSSAQSGVQYVLVTAENAHSVAGYAPSSPAEACCSPRQVTYLDLLEHAHAHLMAEAFPHGLEEFAIWRRLLDEDPTSARYHLSFGVALREQQEGHGDGFCSPIVDLVGLAVVEHYKMSQTLWLGYIAVDPLWRGQGIAKRLVRFCHEQLMNGTIRQDERPIQFILCAKRSGNDEHDVVPSELRHKLYRSLGFVPLDFDFYDCGRLRESHPSALAVCRPPELDDGTGRYPGMRIVKFIEDLYSGILEEEGKVVTDELDPYIRLLERSADGAFSIGHRFWA